MLHAHVGGNARLELGDLCAGDEAHRVGELGVDEADFIFVEERASIADDTGFDA